jgi:hypothetical protein
VFVLNRKLKVSINPRLINKNERKDASLFSKGWVNESFTPGELAAEIDKGVAYCSTDVVRRQTSCAPT